MLVCADRYLGRRFDAQHYNCWHLARDVWRDLTGLDLGDLTRVGAAAAQSPRFVRLLRSESPCLALALRRGGAPHVGVVLRRNVLHLTETGARYEPAEAFGRGFTEVAFYRPAPEPPRPPAPPPSEPEWLFA